MLPAFGMPFCGVSLSNEPLANVGFSNEECNECAAVTVAAVQPYAQGFTCGYITSGYITPQEFLQGDLGFARATDFTLPDGALLFGGAGWEATRVKLGRVDTFQPAVQITFPTIGAQLHIKHHCIAIDHADELSVVELGRRKNTHRKDTKNSEQGESF